MKLVHCVSRAVGGGLLAVLLLPAAAWGWGNSGHRIVAQLGEDGLSAPARQRLRDLIGARRLAQLADWPDFIRAEKKWNFVKSWHFLTVEDGQDLAAVLSAAAATPEPDNVVEAIEFFAGVLRGDEARSGLFRDLLKEKGVEPLDGSIEVTALAFLVHFVGDVHQPLHVGRGGDFGGNSISVNWFEEVSNLHTVWDEGLIESEKLSFTEYVDFLARQFAGSEGEWRGGRPADWAAESIRHRQGVYEIWSKTSATNFLPDLGYDYAHGQIEVVNRRLFQGGVRAAELLDSILAAGPPAADRGRRR